MFNKYISRSIGKKTPLEPSNHTRAQAHARVVLCLRLRVGTQGLSSPPQDATYMITPLSSEQTTHSHALTCVVAFTSDIRTMDDGRGSVNSRIQKVSTTYRQ